MEPSPKVSGVSRRTTIAHDDRRQGQPETGRVESTQETLRLVEVHRVNLLLMGGDEVVQPLVESLAARFHQPVGTWSPGERLVLPPAERTGTMVLNDVGALALQDQIQLLEWLGTAIGRTQVVSTTPAPLLPRVESGKFIDTLYYRLNTVCVDATA
jgi:transcriptional regulator of acetoin/glycerol metabolism